MLIAVAALLWLTSIGANASSRLPPAQNPVRMAEEVFQNVQVLKGIPADEFLDTMGMFSPALLFDCASCHAQEIISIRRDSPSRRRGFSAPGRWS